MNIGIVVDYYQKSGGGENFVNSELKTLKNLQECLKDKINFYYIVTNKDSLKNLNKRNYNTLYFNKDNLLNRLSLFLNLIDNIRKLVFKLKLNSFDNFLKKKKINFLIFVTPSKLVYYCRGINFISTLWELQHKTHPHLEEYKNIYFDLKERDNIAKFISLYSFAIFVGTRKSAEDFSKFYACDKSRIVEKYTESIIVKTAKKLEIKKMDKKKDDYVFYPAQFWSHKNHLFVVDAFVEIKKQNIDLKCIFVGSDKGHLKKIKQQIYEKKLSNYFIFYDYLSDEEIIKLYMNCKAVIIPTIVGSYTFPHVEAFYFKKLVFGSVENLDFEFKNRVIEIDLKNPKNFINVYKRYFKKNENIEKIIRSNKVFYDENFSDNMNVEIYKTLINNYMAEIK
mgnify:FL=1